MHRLILIVTLFLFGCATPYGPRGLTGGFKDRKIDDNTYIVSFFGNGKTPEQKVWNYWMYRCAELTLEKGYQVYALEPSNEHAKDDAAPQPLAFTTLPVPQHDAPLTKVYYTYSYIQVTTYSSKAFVKMYKLPMDHSVVGLLDAQEVKKMLKPYIDSEGKAPLPERKDIFLRAGVEAQLKLQQQKKEDSDARRNST